MLTVMNYNNVINISTFNLPLLVNDSILHSRELVKKRLWRLWKSDRTKLLLVSSTQNLGDEHIHDSIVYYGLQRSFRCQIRIIVVW
jgi:hypothetical protein